MDDLSPTARRLIEAALVEDEPDAQGVDDSWGQVLTGIDSLNSVRTAAIGSGRILAPEPARRPRTAATPGERIGRYFVLDVLGKGAMGVVYRAYDPELERAVALKVVNPRYAARRDADEARARLVSEARALARLSHPNVTAIYDVGVHGEHVYLAMELVEGGDVAAWLRKQSRSWREVVEVFRAAAEGVAAAHARGLVHRDIKPSNILLGEDGRVRVTDFGIARVDAGIAATPTDAESDLGPTDEGITQVGFVVGTPAYMAPEQHGGDPVGPAADQYALCVALYEALYGTRPFKGSTREMAFAKLEAGVAAPRESSVPRWVWAVVQRGLQPKPAQRHADVRALCTALGDDPVRRRRRGLVAMGAVGVVVLGTVGWARAWSGPAPCDGVGGEMASVWSAERKEGMRTAFVDSGRVYAETTFDRVAEFFDTRAQQWVTMRGEACEATWVRREQSEAMLDRRMACLDRRMDDMDALVEVLGKADASVVDRALDATGRLRSLDRCADVSVLQAQVAPPEDAVAQQEAADIRGELASARAERHAGHFDDGLRVAEAARARSDALDYAPVRAEAMLVQAHLLDEQGRAVEALALTKEALWAAQAVGHDQAAAEAAVLLVWLQSERRGDPEAGLEWARYAEATLQRAGGDDDLQGRLWLNEGAARVGAGQFDEGQEAYDRALGHFREQFDDDHPAIPKIVFNVANLLYQRGHYEDALVRYRDALEQLERLHGPGHPRCAVAHDAIGNTLRALGQMDEAVAEHQRSAELLRAALGADHPDVALSLMNLGHAYDQMQRLEDAQRLYEEALELLGPHSDHVHLPVALNNLGLLHADHGNPAKGLPLVRRALDLLEARLGPNNPQLISPISALARLHTELGQIDQALALIDRQHGLAVAAHGPDHRNAAVALANMGNALRAADRLPEALERFRACLAAFERNRDATPTDITIALNDVNAALMDLGRAEEAMPGLERALTASQDERVMVSARIDSMFNMATVLAERGVDFPRARRLGEQVREMIAGLGPSGASALVQVDAWLASLPASP